VEQLIGDGTADARYGGPMTKRILVVDDQEDNRNIVRDLLRNAGFEMIEAGRRKGGGGRPSRTT
jgi:response regulator RpfG family c-di-GMP phosphodiesterase